MQQARVELPARLVGKEVVIYLPCFPFLYHTSGQVGIVKFRAALQAGTVLAETALITGFIW